MSRTFVWPLLAVAIISAAIGSSAESRAQGSGSREDEEAIKGVIAEMTDGFNRHDAEAATRMYTPDADFVSVRGEEASGRSAIEKGLAAILATRAREATLKTEDVRIRFVRPDVVIAHVTNELSGLVAPSGQKLPSQHELSIRVFVKDNGTWRVTAFHNTMIRPFEGAPSGTSNR
jgi:uncharacterized protein (TIGR02246 family)